MMKRNDRVEMVGDSGVSSSATGSENEMPSPSSFSEEKNELKMKTTASAAGNLESEAVFRQLEKMKKNNFCDWSNNNLNDFTPAAAATKEKIENGNLDFLANTWDSAVRFSKENAKEKVLKREECSEEAVPTSFLDGEETESDHESHTSSLESIPSDEGVSGGRNLHGRDGYCSEEDLGSSTSCSLDSFEITSPLGTLDIGRKKTADFPEEAEEETPKIETKDGDYSRFFVPETNSENGSKMLTIAKNVSTSQEYTGSYKEKREEGNQGFNSETKKSEKETFTAAGGSSKTCIRVSLQVARMNIDKELSQLDTRLPNLDFEKLEEQLNCAAKEREMDQRKLMFEEVRRKLAMDTDDSGFPPIPATRPARSNLGKRLQSGKSLQVCFMNDGLTSEDEDSSESCSNSEAEGTGSFSFPKSKSTPNLSGKKKIGGTVGRSVSSVEDSTKRASELRRAAWEKEAEATKSPESRQAKLEEETRLMLAKAKQAARMQMEVERQSKNSKSFIEDIVGITLSRRRLTRPQLMRMSITQLQLILNDLHTKIESLNEELVQLLVDRDNLHMEQDSMLVDVEDLVQ